MPNLQALKHMNDPPGEAPERPQSRARQGQGGRDPDIRPKDRGRMGVNVSNSRAPGTQGFLD